jgi:hypothetical protein
VKLCLLLGGFVLRFWVLQHHKTQSTSLSPWLLEKRKKWWRFRGFGLKKRHVGLYYQRGAQRSAEDEKKKTETSRGFFVVFLLLLLLLELLALVLVLFLASEAPAGLAAAPKQTRGGPSF